MKKIPKNRPKESSDFIIVEHKAGDRANQKVKKFKDICPTCKKDKGYIFKSSMGIDCRNCSLRKSFLDGKRDINHNFYGKRHPVETPNQGIIHTRSSYETFYLKFLNKNKVNYLFEPKRFELSDGTSYLPDIYLIKDNKYIELKGREHEETQRKYNLFIEEYPHIKIEKLKKEDLTSIGYSGKDYNNYEYICIDNQKDWKIVLHKPEEYVKLHGDDSDAITFIETRELNFKADKLTPEIIDHEICHIFMSNILAPVHKLDAEDIEEFICDFLAKYGLRVILLRFRIAKVLEELTKKVYNLDPESPPNFSDIAFTDVVKIIKALTTVIRLNKDIFGNKA